MSGVKGMLYWSKRILINTHSYGKNKQKKFIESAFVINEFEIPFEFKGIYRTMAEEKIRRIFAYKQDRNKMYLVTDVNFDKQKVKVIQYAY